MAFERFNGGSLVNQLGYFFGDNAFVTIAVQGAEVFDSGVIAPLAEFKRVYGLTTAQDISVLDDSKITFTNVQADGTEGTAAALTNDAAYTRAYAAQENLKRLVDTVQQRAVVIGTSDNSAATIVTGDNFFNDTGSVRTACAITGGVALTFLVERSAVFNKDGTDLYGQPTGTVQVGYSLMEALNGIALLDTSAADLALAPSATAVSGSYGVKIIGQGGDSWGAIL